MRKHRDGIRPSLTFRKWIRLHLRDDDALGAAARRVEASAIFPGGSTVTRQRIRTWASDVDADAEDVSALLAALDTYQQLIKKSGTS